MATEPLSLSDGNLTFTIRKADGTENQVSIDLLILRLTCEQCEDQHKLTTKDGRIVPTTEFLVDLAGRLNPHIPGCTPSLAWQLWNCSIEQMDNLKKNMNGTPKSPTGLESTPSGSAENSGSGY